VIESVLRLGEATAHGARDYGSIAVGHKQAQRTARSKHLRQRGKDPLDVVDLLQHAVTHHEVSARRVNDVQEAIGVTLYGADLDTGIVGAALQCGQRIRVGVHNRGAVP
jgi:hypothetical protein